MATRPGLKAVELFQAVRAGRIKALWIMATNPAVSLPQADDAVDALKACPFVVVSDVVRHTDTTRHAHALLPAAAWGEKDGTVTNSERRISRQRAFLPLPGEARPDWWAVAEVAKRMGFGEAFAYRNPAEVFAEHAALSGFENAGTRDFDLSGFVIPAQGASLPPSPLGGAMAPPPLPPSPLGGGVGGEGAMLAKAAVFPSPGAARHPTPGGEGAHLYDSLPPTQWPVSADGGTARLFADGRFYTPNGRARMLAITPRAPATPVDAAHPYTLNTGRIRDQWHTMTRTAKTPKLLAHLAEPFIDLHPDDLAALGLADGDLAEVKNPHGSLRLRVQANDGQILGHAFAPIHWNDRFSAAARVDVLAHAITDPVSGQPEFKQTPVAIAPYPARWHGFVMTRGDSFQPGENNAAYWTRIRAAACWRWELAETAELDLATLKARLPNGAWITLDDPAATRLRGALIVDDRLEAVYFIERRAQTLPPRHWLESLFTREKLDAGERAALLMGRPGSAAPECGRIVCACYGVGEADLKKAIMEGADSVEALGIRLKAGTNCGSCIPELKRLLT
jgi:assimilatory nitrate reductase catalytic subunit